MFTAKVETVFFAGHQITYADGTVEDLHEHEWVVRVAVKSAKLDAQGFVVDFLWLKDELKKITKSLITTSLEDHHYFVEADINASAENVAKYIFEELAPKIKGHAKLASVKVQESPGCWAKYAV
jgi:6-pyruvoyltetrahydropterin/6-carboxytetrahydropterin synthase